MLIRCSNPNITIYNCVLFRKKHELNHTRRMNILKIIRRNHEPALADFSFEIILTEGLTCLHLDFKIEMWAKYSRISTAKFLMQFSDWAIHILHVSIFNSFYLHSNIFNKRILTIWWWIEKYSIEFEPFVEISSWDSFTWQFTTYWISIEMLAIEVNETTHLSNVQTDWYPFNFGLVEFFESILLTV